MKSALEEELHLHASQVDDVVVLQLLCLCIQRFAINHRVAGALDMGNEIALRTLGDNRDLNAWLTQCCQGLFHYV